MFENNKIKINRNSHRNIKMKTFVCISTCKMERDGYHRVETSELFT